jgi:hypothetical protein
VDFAKYLEILKTRLIFSRISESVKLVLRLVVSSLPPFCRVRRVRHFRDDSKKKGNLKFHYRRDVHAFFFSN